MKLGRSYSVTGCLEEDIGAAAVHRRIGALETDTLGLVQGVEYFWNIL